MKKYIIITILIFFAALNCISQTVQVNKKDSTVFTSTSAASAAVRVVGSVTPDSLNVPTFDTANVHARYAGSTTFFSGALYTWDGSKWVSGGGTITGGAFTTSNIDIGYNPGTNLTAAQLIEKVWYGLQPPTATLTGGTTLELTNASTVSQTLNWGAGRGSNTPILTSIVVAGTSQSFSQPAQSGTVLGTQAVSVPANTTTIYSNVVTASDAQTATATTTFSFLGKKYYGLVSDTTGIGSGTQDAAILALTTAFASSKTLSVNTGVITGTKFWVYVYPASLGSLSALSFNSIPALEAMNTATRSFTNALGYSQSYILYWNKQGQTSSSDITAQ